ncbi:NADH dehydrogenase [ubiquinone] 1 alpha subcomplex assembly factor 3 [Smittium mucronatum]|uniref:NADH dehydrogenase [ubiquinone] 1 alpha subcomplex assembly factor 3 n=1 Tax=Smittium mucronatum TaxID=133383 RepID=A0A1R0H4J4_9FUNG|nr:NADH dehydrogenase [ubiquinone] 1 alpha subcomplex assembly factor 3 [Smittium mucronatum]
MLRFSRSWYTSESKLSHTKNPPPGLATNQGEYPSTLKPAQIKSDFDTLQNMFVYDTQSLSIAKDYLHSFKLSDSRTVPGSLVIVENVAFQWTPQINANGSESSNSLSEAENIDGKSLMSQMGEENLRILEVVTPKPEILVFGTGRKLLQLSAEARKYILKQGIKLEVSNTRNACGTYNILLEEGRKVAILALSNSI